MMLRYSHAETSNASRGPDEVERYTHKRTVESPAHSQGVDSISDVKLSSFLSNTPPYVRLASFLRPYSIPH